MRINEYETFEQFYEEYNYDRDVFQEHYIGLEFKYANNYYFQIERDAQELYAD